MQQSNPYKNGFQKSVAYHKIFPESVTVAFYRRFSIITDQGTAKLVKKAFSDILVFGLVL